MPTKITKTAKKQCCLHNGWTLQSVFLCPTCGHSAMSNKGLYWKDIINKLVFLRKTCSLLMRGQFSDGTPYDIQQPAAGGPADLQDMAALDAHYNTLQAGPGNELDVAIQMYNDTAFSQRDILLAAAEAARRNPHALVPRAGVVKQVVFILKNPGEDGPSHLVGVLVDLPGVYGGYTLRGESTKSMRPFQMPLLMDIEELDADMDPKSAFMTFEQFIRALFGEFHALKTPFLTRITRAVMAAYNKGLTDPAADSNLSETEDSSSDSEESKASDSEEDSDSGEDSEEDSGEEESDIEMTDVGEAPRPSISGKAPRGELAANRLRAAAERERVQQGRKRAGEQMQEPTQQRRRVDIYASSSTSSSISALLRASSSSSHAATSAAGSSSHQWASSSSSSGMTAPVHEPHTPAVQAVADMVNLCYSGSPFGNSFSGFGRVQELEDLESTLRDESVFTVADSFIDPTAFEEKAADAHEAQAAQEKAAAEVQAAAEKASAEAQAAQAAAEKAAAEAQAAQEAQAAAEKAAAEAQAAHEAQVSAEKAAAEAQEAQVAQAAAAEKAQPVANEHEEAEALQPRVSRRAKKPRTFLTYPN
jgi:hypothetical protein